MYVKLNVPYAEKNEAKRHGARWSRLHRTWYAYIGPMSNVCLGDVERWCEPDAVREQEAEYAAIIKDLCSTISEWSYATSCIDFQAMAPEGVRLRRPCISAHARVLANLLLTDEGVEQVKAFHDRWFFYVGNSDVAYMLDEIHADVDDLAKRMRALDHVLIFV